MADHTSEILLNMFPHFTHIVDRITTPNWQIKPEICRRHNLILIYDGEAVFHCNGTDFRGNKGTLVYFRPTDDRWAHTIPEKLMKCFAVDFFYTCPTFQAGDWQMSEVELPFNTVERIGDPYLLARLTDLYTNLIQQWLSGKKNRLIRCRAIFMEIVTLLLAWKNGDNINFDKIRKVEKVINYMSANYAKRLSLKDLAQINEICPSYLGTIFKEVTGSSPVDYLIRIRINKAKELINDGCNITDTADKTGFSSVYYFSKCFKKVEGVAPSAYKNSDL